jgi:L-ascorbate metabolism protein UlaG (beta-lactamase superfamily)
LEFGADAVLTDPYFDNHRLVRFNEAIGLTVGDLPRLAAIIGGHGVFDHWQPRSLRSYPHRDTTPVFVATRRMARLARRAGFANVEVLTWGERRMVSDSLSITSVPGERITGMLTNNYVLSTPDVSVFFGSEARSLDPIRDVANKHRLDVAVLPIDGAQLFRRTLVMDAATALAAARTLGARLLIPIHYAQRPVFGVLRCPSGVHDLNGRARHMSDIEVNIAATGARTVIRLPGSPGARA